MGSDDTISARDMLLGRRMSDLDLVAANGPLRVFSLLHDGRSTQSRPGGFDITPWHACIARTWDGGTIERATDF